MANISQLLISRYRKFAGSFRKLTVHQRAKTHNAVIRRWIERHKPADLVIIAGVLMAFVPAALGNQSRSISYATVGDQTDLKVIPRVYHALKGKLDAQIVTDVFAPSGDACRINLTDTGTSKSKVIVTAVRPDGVIAVYAGIKTDLTQGFCPRNEDIFIPADEYQILIGNQRFND